jgi:hypothetical protein
MLEPVEDKQYTAASSGDPPRQEDDNAETAAPNRRNARGGI